MAGWTRRQFLGATAAAGGVGLGVLPGALSSALASDRSSFEPSRAFDLAGIALDTMASDVLAHGARPTVISRSLGVAMTAMYDAWAAYDHRAVGTRLGDELRRPHRERTLANKQIAISQATFRALIDLHPEQATSLASAMRRMGLDPDDHTTDLARPQGVGNVAAAAVTAFRHGDGANQLGDAPGSNGQPYSDYTGYRPVNTVDHLVDPNRWQPIPFLQPDGSVIAPGFLTPQWGLVRPFGLRSASQFRPVEPPHVGSARLLADVNKNIAANASLTVAQKAQVEYMRDGPHSTAQSGHWLVVARFVSQRDRNSLDRDVKLFFAVMTVAMDAFIASWEAKRFYDTSRPYTLVRVYRKGQTLRGWGGPGKGVVTLPAEQWHPYSPFSFVTPPFPGYPSGHSSVSGASGRLLALFTGSDRLSFSVPWVAGSITEPQFTCATIQTQEGQLPPPADLSCALTLHFPTFSGMAEFAGESRILGGYHIESDNGSGLELGRQVADFDFEVIRALFEGRERDEEQVSEKVRGRFQRR